MRRFLGRFALTAAVFVGLDLLWLGVLMARFYDTQLGSLALRGPDGHLAARVLPAVLVYLVLPLGITLLALPESLAARRVHWKAPVLGLVTYATYDLSNLATLGGWNTTLTLVDIAWGITIHSLTTAIVVAILSRRRGA